MNKYPNLAVRWTIGDVSLRGFEALRLSIWGAWRVFGPAATYVVCVNSVPLGDARARTGEIPEPVLWRDSSREVPALFRRHLDQAMAEGVGWKFAPIRLFSDKYELALDNDCILWDLPEAIRAWIADGEGCVLAEDVAVCFGQFADLCGPEPRNSGIRGVPPGFDLERALETILIERPVSMNSELDEQGLVTAALSRKSSPRVVRLDEVTICSPFPPHVRGLGRCGAHFVGLNAKHLPWKLEGRPAVEHIREHWLHCRERLYERVAPPNG